MNKAEELIACLECEIAKRDARIVELERYEHSFNEWHDKTEWVQSESSSLSAKYLGCHRADVMRDLIDQLRAELAAIKAQGVVMPERETELFNAAYGAAVESGWESVKCMARQIWDAARLNAAPVQQVSVPDISRLLEALERVATLHIVPPYTTPQSSQLMMLKGIADQALESYRAAAPAAPAADAGLVEAFCKVEQALDLIGGIRHGKNVTQDELWQSCELLDAALAAHRSTGVV